MNFKKILVVLLCVAILGITACSNGGSEEGEEMKKDISIACAETTQDLVAEVVPYMEEKGYNVTYEIFDNNVNTLIAIDDGSMDALMLVHKPFMENYNQSNDADLVMVEPYIFASGMGLFSEKYDSIEQIPDGATIAVINDSMNMDRGLRILHDAGLITLDPDVEKSTLVDIVDNPHNFKFVEMDQTQTVRSLTDVDAAIAFFAHMKNADKDFNSYLARDQHPELFPQGVVVKEENADKQWVKDLVETFRSEEVEAFAQDHYGGLYEYIEY